jgi:hypothetical protein
MGTVGKQRLATAVVCFGIWAAALAGSRFLLQPPTVLAGHAIQNGNCWQAAAPLLCKTTYDCVRVVPYTNLNCPTQQLRVRLVDSFSDGQPAWYPSMFDAKVAWDNFSGPQSMSEIDRTDDTYVYLYDSVTGQNGLVSGMFGLTYNCNSSNFCTSSASAMDIYYSKIYFNRDKMNSAFIGNDDRQNVFAHEIGHTFGLFHHSDTHALMYPFQQESIGGPVFPYEWGSSPVCGSASTFGIRCIYDIGGTPP